MSKVLWIDQNVDNYINIGYAKELRAINSVKFLKLFIKMAKLLLSLVKPGGYIFAYKAKSENIQIEMNAISSLVGEWDVKNLSVPFLEDVERNLVVIKK